jgi:hypothetical protein
MYGFSFQGSLIGEHWAIVVLLDGRIVGCVDGIRACEIKWLRRGWDVVNLCDLIKLQFIHLLDEGVRLGLSISV